MTRKVWVQYKGRMIPKDEFLAMDTSDQSGPKVLGDIPDHVSPVTGEVIHGRAGMRRHMKEHGLTNTSDFKNHWKDSEKKRRDFYRGESSEHRSDVKGDLINAMRKYGEI